MILFIQASVMKGQKEDIVTEYILKVFCEIPFVIVITTI